MATAYEGWADVPAPVEVRTFVPARQRSGCPDTVTIHGGAFVDFGGRTGPRQAAEPLVLDWNTQRQDS